MRRIATALFCCAALAGCSGGSNSAPPTPLAGVSQPPPPTSSSVARFVVKIPSQATAKAASLRPQYVSVSTQSIAIAVNGGAPTFANLTPTSANCQVVSGTLTCTVNVPAPTGTDTFAVTTYDQQLNGSGAVPAAAQALSTATMSATIAPNIANTVPITLDGIVAKVVLTLNPTSTIARTAANIPLTVNAQDADGNTIVGPGNFSAPITITDSDTSGATTLSSSTIAGPAGTALTVAFNGAALASATFSATASGVPPQNVTPATLKITAGVAATFSKGVSGDTLGRIAKGSDGNFWFVDKTTNAIDVIDPTGNLIHAYPTGAPGPPEDITAGPAGDAHLYFLTQGNIGSIRVSDGAIALYPLSSRVSPSSGRITVGPDNALWFTEGFGADVVGRLDPTKPASTTNPQEFKQIFSALAKPQGIVAGPDGNLWICEYGNNSIGRYNVSGPLVGTVTEFPIPTPASLPAGIARGADNNLWFNESDQRINRVAKITPSGTVTEYVVTGARANGTGVLATPDGFIFFAEDPRDGKFLRVDTAGNMIQYPLPANVSISSLALDAVGSLYFVQAQNGLGRFVY
ncbi:MAG: hypothetical protein NVSMB19_15720 [Vulcanimicrobiaceae bacterium]